MIYVLASVRLKEGANEKFLEIFKANIPAVRAEEGCLEYVPTVDIGANLPPQQLDPAVVTIVEKWESVEALHNHLQAPHMREYRDKTKDLVDDTVLKILTEA